MNLNDLPTHEPDIDKLKDDLASFCTKYAITKFEADDIIELLEDGEKVDWIIDQLRSENEEIDKDALNSLLDNIKTIVAPPEKEEEEMEEEGEKLGDDETIAEQELDREIPDLSQLDLSQLELPPGMKLPPGMNMEQIQQLMKSPQGEFLADFSQFCQEKGLDDIQGTMSNPVKIQELNQEWMSTPRDAFEGKTPAEMLTENPALMPQKVETYRRDEPRIGRNDPCPCGSGKKYKKCCGRSK